jgi:signal transduction histidine kinase
LNEKLTKIGLHTQNLSHIISDFGDFYRPNKYQEEIDLGDAVVQAYKLLEDSLSSANIDVRFELASVNRVMLYRNEFLQVILNIINNAKEQFKLKNTDNAQIMMKSYDKDEAAVLEIGDNAGGISEDIIDNIFDPYFSTKFDINGTGLGLYMAKSIIEQHHGGKIYAQNVEDGVKFIIEIGTKRADEKK